MLGWLARQYADIRGNLKWWIVASIFWLLYSYARKLIGQIPHVPGWLGDVILFFVFVLAFVWLVKRITKPGKVDSPLMIDPPKTATLGGPTSHTLEPPMSWCDELEIEYAKNISQRLHDATWEPEPHYQAKEPYINFKITFINATIFHMMFEKIDGPTHYRRDPLARHPTILDPPIILHRGERKIITIQQHISPDVARELQEARGVVGLDFSRVGITFNVVGHGPNSPSKCFWFGHDNVVVAIR